MDDSTILMRIRDLVSEEHAILDRDGAGPGQPEDRQRLDELQTTLDRCWDLLRQRRALRGRGKDADLARARSAATVEHYEQ